MDLETASTEAGEPTPSTIKQAEASSKEKRRWGMGSRLGAPAMGVDMFSNNYPVRGPNVSMNAGPGVGLHMTTSPNFAMPMLRIHGGIRAEINLAKERLGVTIIGIPFPQVARRLRTGTSNSSTPPSVSP